MQEVKFDFKLSETQEKERQVLINDLKKNKIVQSFLREHHLDESVIERKAQMLADYALEKAKCDNCPGLHACKQDHQGFVLGIQTEPLFSREYQACAYQAKQDRLRAHKKQYSILECDESFLEARVESLFDQKSNTNYKVSLKAVIDWFKAPTDKGFYFYGAPGTGKTHLAMAIANYFALKNKKVACVHVPTLASKFPNSYYEGPEKEQYMHLLKKAYCVVFDDIGAETYTSYFRDEVLFPILNARMENKALTLFTSNHSMTALANHYRFNHKADDEQIKSMRMIERIQTLSQSLSIEGLNRRG